MSEAAPNAITVTMIDTVTKNVRKSSHATCRHSVHGMPPPARAAGASRALPGATWSINVRALSAARTP